MLTPAEAAAANGHAGAMPPPGSATQIPAVSEAVDQAAVAGASPYVDDPVTEIAQAPPGQGVDPHGH